MINKLRTSKVNLKRYVESYNRLKVKFYESAARSTLLHCWAADKRIEQSMSMKMLI